MRNLLSLTALSFAITTAAWGQIAPGAQLPETTLKDPLLVQKALAIELAASQDSTHPMRYVLRKSSPRLATTKEMIETRDGSVAMLVAVNGQPLSAADALREQARLNGLLADPSKQRHRKSAQDEDMGRALKVLRALPNAFIYHYAGPATSGSLAVQRFTFTPNPRFNPPDLETEVLTALSGEILIDPQQMRVVRLEGRLQQDVDFGWGILGRLYKGGWITIEQADLGGGVWRIVRFQMAMSGRVVIKNRTFNTTEEESEFAPVPQNLSYRQGIAMLRSQPFAPPAAGR